MKFEKSRQVITLSDYSRFEKRQGGDAPGAVRQEEERKSVFLETLFNLLGGKRHTIISFITMKLDAGRRRCFRDAMAQCESIEDECRCVKSYLRHLALKDVNALLVGIRRMLTGKIDAIAYPGEGRPDMRLAKFARTFGLTEADVNEWMMLFLLAS